MTRVLCLVTVGLFALGVVGLAAHSTQSEHVSVGEVISVEATTLTVKETQAPGAGDSREGNQSGVVRKFTVDEETKLTKGPQPIKLADIRVGDAVTVRFVLNKGENVAKRIEVQSKETELE